LKKKLGKYALEVAKIEKSYYLFYITDVVVMIIDLVEFTISLILLYKWMIPPFSISTKDGRKPYVNVTKFG